MGADPHEPPGTPPATCHVPLVKCAAGLGRPNPNLLWNVPTTKVLVGPMSQEGRRHGASPELLRLRNQDTAVIKRPQKTGLTKLRTGFQQALLPVSQKFHTRPASPNPNFSLSIHIMGGKFPASGRSMAFLQDIASRSGDAQAESENAVWLLRSPNANAGPVEIGP